MPADSEWWKRAVFYQIYPPHGFFDSNGDGIGDLKGIEGQARLHAWPGLGVDAIWLSPVFTSPMKDFGYDVSDYRGIDPIFGTMGDFDDLIAAVHARGLKLIIDQVWSHTSDRHPWFIESAASRDNWPKGGLVRVGRDGQSRMGRRPTTGWRCSAGPRGAGARGGGSTTCTTS